MNFLEGKAIRNKENKGKIYKKPVQGSFLTDQKLIRPYIASGEIQIGY